MTIIRLAADIKLEENAELIRISDEAQRFGASTQHLSMACLIKPRVTVQVAKTAHIPKLCPSTDESSPSHPERAQLSCPPLAQQLSSLKQHRPAAAQTRYCCRAMCGKAQKDSAFTPTFTQDMAGKVPREQSKCEPVLISIDAMKIRDLALYDLRRIADC